MTCERCGGHVTWRGPLSNLTHTQCEDCGATNCQIPEPYQMDDECEDDDQ